MWLVVLVPAWLLGIWLGAQVLLAQGVASSLALLLLGGLLLGGRVRGLRLVLLGGLCLLAGSVRYHIAQPRPTPESVWLLADSGPVLLEGYVVQEPRRTAATQQVVIETTAARWAATDQPAARVQGRVLLMVPPYPAYQYGQRLLVRGFLSTPPHGPPTRTVQLPELPRPPADLRADARAGARTPCGLHRQSGIACAAATAPTVAATHPARLARATSRRGNGDAVGHQDGCARADLPYLPAERG